VEEFDQNTKLPSSEQNIISSIWFNFLIDYKHKLLNYILNINTTAQKA